MQEEINLFGGKNKTNKTTLSKSGCLVGWLEGG